MNELENIYTKTSIWLTDLDTAQYDDDDGWEFTFFYKAFEIVFDKFKVVKKFKYTSTLIFDLYDDRDLKNDLSNIHTIFSKSLTKYICDCYLDLKGTNLSTANKNNIEHFLREAFENKSIYEKIKKAKKYKNDYITIREFCKNNFINESKFKEILRNEGYYNSEFFFMPSRKAMDREKAFISNYFMPYSEKIDQKYTGNFYILWENQFLRNMMLKHYEECEKDAYEYHIRYRQPKTYNTLIKRIRTIISCFCGLGLSINGNFKEIHEFNQFEWDDLDFNFHISHLHEYLSGRFLPYKDFKYLEAKINKIVIKNIETIDSESLKLEVIEHLEIFNKYAKHYKDKYDKQDTKLLPNPNHPPYKLDKNGDGYYSYDN